MEKKESRNRTVINAKQNVNDEFYTRYEDIEKELIHYKHFLKDKKVYCNCDSENSNFWKYLVDNFNKFKLKHLTATSIDGIRLDFDGKSVTVSECYDDCGGILGFNKGDFRSIYCVNILKESDVIITNPPFSLFREYVNLLFEYNKKFIILGSVISTTYKDVVKKIKNNNLFIGQDYVKHFENTKKKVCCIWLSSKKVKENKHLQPIPYIKENYNTIYNTDYVIPIVDNLNNIPKFGGVMLVPATIFQYNNNDFIVEGQINNLGDAKHWLTLPKPSDYELCANPTHFCLGRHTDVYKMVDGKLHLEFKCVLIRLNKELLK